MAVPLLSFYKKEQKFMSYVIGVDLGTQSLKGLLVDPEGKIVAEATCAHDPIYPNPAGQSSPLRIISTLSPPL